MTDSKRPLYQQIFNDMMEGIRTGIWKDGERVPSEKELAEQYNVSRITSKKALVMLNDAGHIQRMPGKGSFVRKGVTGNPELAPGRTGTGDRPLLIGMILPDFDESSGTDLLKSVEKTAADNGIFMILRLSYGDQSQEERSIDEVLLLGVDGIIIMPVHGEYYAPKILRLVLDRFPVVFVDRHLRGLNAPFVGTDNLGAAKKATDYLLDIGHRRISFLTSPSSHTTTIEDRMEGFIKSHAEHVMAIDESLWLTDLTATLPGRNTPDNIQKDILSIQSLLQNRPDVTCLFAAEYNIALLAMEAVKALGLNVPNDISLLCFDNPHHFMWKYALTHLRQREMDIGEASVRLLLKQIRHEPGPAEKLFLEADLVVGYSTAKV